MKVTYIGNEILTYMGYYDTETGTTLVCVPGKSYDITPEVMPTDGRFTEWHFSEILPSPEVPEEALEAEVN